ncbi:MAG: phosphoribosylformimino-5-aminoimidazole carboxamide ribotide isomerase [SAR324 cluster bacterium]|nr:phosphoribosylformimino-5-aminoimidazole carboxamide ribotide isomerase [SAR324 cluster bacterium]
MKFRPCIDLHQGIVKQIVGSTLTNESGELKTNFEAKYPPSWFAQKYSSDGLTGGHVIQLGQGNLKAAKAALAAFPQGLQIGGGVNLDNAKSWLDAGADKIIVTSFVFSGGQINMDRLKALSKLVGPERLVLDLSCRKQGETYFVVTDLWQKFTDFAVTPNNLDRLKPFASEFLLHAVDVEGKGLGVDAELIQIMAKWSGLVMTYAGGIASLNDLEILKNQGRGVLDFTVGSALDLFGGVGLKYNELVKQEGF